MLKIEELNGSKEIFVSICWKRSHPQPFLYKSYSIDHPILDTIDGPEIKFRLSQKKYVKQYINIYKTLVINSNLMIEQYCKT